MFKFISVWKSWIIGKNENKPAFRRQLAQKIKNKELKYVSERIGDDDFVIGKSGKIDIKGNELCVLSQNDIIFRAKIETLMMNELLSLEGIILTGKDLENNERERCIIAYYTYYRKIEN